MTFEAMRAAFVNCSRSQLKALPPPPGLADLDWANLDYVGWRDPRAPRRAYLVAPHDGDVVGLALRAPQSGGRRKGSAMCALCASVRTTAEVDLFVAPRAGGAGKAGNTVGTYICSDLACSLYVRGLRKLDLPQGERLPVPARVARLNERLAAFVARAAED